ncbi:hypothetical protein CGMCC3_g7632 [Colletotrichum fructicola]|nr:uncharacterized protein CGMCC3_g7632 [Colletotrichum fructicola]KAE9576660.1 hypothetical protein CGMCC3_g7632 [Colletotrichum fructicola]
MQARSSPSSAGSRYWLRRRRLVGGPAGLALVSGGEGRRHGSRQSFIRRAISCLVAA